MSLAQAEAPRHEAPAWLPTDGDAAAPAAQQPFFSNAMTTASLQTGAPQQQPTADGMQALYGNAAVTRGLLASASRAPRLEQVAAGTQADTQTATPASEIADAWLTRDVTSDLTNEIAAGEKGEPTGARREARAPADATSERPAPTGSEPIPKKEKSASPSVVGIKELTLGTGARTDSELEPDRRHGATGTSGVQPAPLLAIHVSGSTPGAVLTSLASVPPSQFASDTSEAEVASQIALANQAQSTRAEIPKIKTLTGMAPVGDPARSGRPASTSAATAAAHVGANIAQRTLKPRSDKQEVTTPTVPPQRAPEPTRLSGPEQPTGDPKTDAKTAQDAQAELAKVAIDDRGIPQGAGSIQPIKLEGEADPAQIDQESRNQSLAVARAAQVERQETDRDFGDGAIGPRPDDSTIVTTIGIHGRRLGKLKRGPAGPSDAELAAGFDASLGPALNRRVLAKSAEYESEEQKFEADKQAAHHRTYDEIAALEGDMTKKQLGCKLETQKEVAVQREQWRSEIGQHQAKYEGAAAGAVAETRGKVAHEKEEGERQIAGHYAEGNRKIAKEHDDAKAKEEQARKDAKKKSSGFFGWVRSKAAALIDWLKDAVNLIYDNVRKAVKAAINLVKEAVLKVIDLVRDAVVGLIIGLASGLKLLVNAALFAFPETRRRINAKIDAGVQTATKFVNDAADTLKKGVAAALDFLASAIDKLLGLIQSIYSGILTFVSMVVSGEFEEIIRRLGYLASAAKTVPDVFEQAALEELLGGNLDEPLSVPELQFATANNLLPETSMAEVGTGAIDGNQAPKPPYNEDNIAVNAVDHDFELSPEMEAELVNELEGEEGGSLEIGGADDRSRSIAAILEEAKGGAEQSTEEESEHEAAPAMSDGLTPTQRAKVKWEMMKDGIAKWWSDNWGKVLLAATAAIVGFIALNIVTGGGVMAVLAALMPILTPLFIGVTVVTLASHAKDYVEKGWEGHIRPAGKSLAHGLAAGVIELISWLTFKAGSAALRGVKAVAKGGLKLAQAGARGAQRLGTVALRAAKAVIERGRIVLQGLGKTKIGAAFKRLSQLGDELLTRLRFRKFRIVLEGRRFRLEGFINPWVLLATGKLKKIETPPGKGRLEVGDRLKIDGTDAVVVGIKGEGSNYVKTLRNTRKPQRAGLFKDLTSGKTKDIAKENARLIIFNAENTAQLRKGIPTALQVPGFQAHHVVPREVARNPAIKKFLDKIKFNVEDGARNGIMLPPNASAAAANPKWANAAVHWGSHGTYSSKVLQHLQEIEFVFKTAGQTKQALAVAAKQVDDLLDELKTALMNGGGKKVNEVL